MTFLILTIFIIDRASKYYILQILPKKGGMIKIIPPFCNLTLTFNQGAAFGILSKNTLFLTIFSIMGIIILFTLYFSEGKKNSLVKLPLTLIISGALGNLFDRLYYGYVIDFLDFDFPDIVIPAKEFPGINFPGFALYRWPAFNIADACICLGVFLLLIMILFKKKKTPLK